MLITGTLIIHKQYKHFLSYDLGFNTDNILNIRLQGTKPELLKKVLAELPEVKAISQSAMITSVGGYWGTAVKNPKNPEDSAYVYFNQVDEHYIPLHAHSLLAGQNFTARQEEVEESEVIVNQQVLKRFNLADQIPANAIGEILKVDGKQLKIIGVMKDFQYGRANNNANKEVVFRYSNADAEYLNLKIASNNLPDTYAKIEALYKKLDPVHPFAAKFYDDEIKDAFSGLEATMKLAGAIAFLAICIASLGLLGMVVFTTETRVKEISIRKVLGASEGKLLFLLGRGFFTLLGIAAAIALPVTYLFFESVMLPMIANHAQIGINEMIIGIMLVMILAVLMIGSQTLKVARTNPVDVLKAE
jgi:ABC-type antimicrobial peptide transport system permease subunit